MKLKSISGEKQQKKELMRRLSGELLSEVCRALICNMLKFNVFVMALRRHTHSTHPGHGMLALHRLRSM
jgi:hypothetical protein